jgi:hypothetical protein
MFEMTHTGKYHGYTFFITHFYRILIAYRAPRLDYRRYSRLGGRLCTIGKREYASDAITLPFDKPPA